MHKEFSAIHFKAWWPNESIWNFGFAVNIVLCIVVLN